MPGGNIPLLKWSDDRFEDSPRTVQMYRLQVLHIILNLWL
jgi:hypothetical protein